LVIKFDKDYRKKKRINKAEAGLALYRYQGDIIMHIKDGFYPSLGHGGRGIAGATTHIYASDFLKATEILQLDLTDPKSAMTRYGSER